MNAINFKQLRNILLLIIITCSCNEQNTKSNSIVKALEEKELGNYDKAISIVNNLISDDSSNAFLYLLRGQIYALENLDSVALTDYNRALNYDTKIVAGYFIKESHITI